MFYAALFAVVGLQMPFLPVWLAAKGLDAGIIGVILAAPMIARIFAMPFAMRYADNISSPRGAIMTAAVLSAVMTAAVGLSRGAGMILATYALSAMAFTAIVPLAEAYALRGLSLRQRAYGPVRLWGSAAFIAANFCGGLVMDVIAAGHLIWLIVGGMIVTSLVAVVLAPADTGTRPPSEPAMPTNPLWRSGVFWAGTAAAGMIQASHGVYYGFSVLQWRSDGLDGVAIGALWALAVVSEIVLFALSGRLPAAFGPRTLLLFGAGGAFVRWSAMALDPPAAALPALQCLHALSYGATHLGTMGFVMRAAPPHLGATAQGYLVTVLGAVMAASMGLSGWLYAQYGAAAYLAMATLALSGGSVVLLMRRAADDPN